jgi:signal peptidase I
MELRIKSDVLFIMITIILFLGLALVSLDIFFVSLYAQDESNISLNQNRSPDLPIANNSIVQLFDKLNRTLDRIAEAPELNFSIVEGLVHRLDNMSVVLNGIKSSLDEIKVSLNDSAIYSAVGLAIGLIAIALSIVIPFIYDMYKRPDLLITQGDNTPIKDRVFLHGRVVNRSHRLLSWINRNTAARTRVTLEFLDDNDTRLNLRNQPILGKWTAAPEPLTPNRQAFDSTKLAFVYDKDIISDDVGEQFDILVKNQGDKECYAMTGDTYEVGPDLRHEEFRIDLTEFKVRIHANSGRYDSNIRTFIIRNNGIHVGDVTMNEE